MRTSHTVAFVILTALSGCSAAGTEPEGGTNTTPIETTPGSAGVPALGAGASLNGRRPFPDDNPWNLDVSGEPIDPSSSTLIASCGSQGLHPDFGTVWNGAPNGIPYVVVSGS